MKLWTKFLETLAGKLTAIPAFAVLVIVVLALVGQRIPAEYRVLVYVVAIGAMIIFIVEIFKKREKSGADSDLHTPNQTSVTPVAPPSEKKSEQNPSSSNARADYLNAVIADCRTVRLVGVDPQAADPSRGGLTLESLYVSLDTTTPVDKKTGKARQPEENPSQQERRLMELGFEGQRLLGALEALSVTDTFRMVLLGLPGTGKSTFVRYVALRMAQAEVDRGKNIQDLLPGWKGGSVLPIIVPLGRMAESIPSGRTKGSADLVEKFILQTLESDDRTTGFAASALAELKQSGGLVLFDGLDEVSDLTMRPIVVQSVEDFVQKYSWQSASRFLVTCRTYSYHHDTKWQMSGWPTHELALLDEEKIQYFVNAWHDEHIRIEPARKPDYERKRKQLLASLQPDDRRRLHEIAPFPIILTMMAVVHTHYGELPNTRAQVYERCVDLLLVRWELERPVSGQSQKTQKRTIIDELGVDRIELDRALWEIAFRAHEGRTVNDKNERGPALVTEDLLTGVLFAHFHDPQKVQIFLDYCQSANGLLMLQGSIAPADAVPGTPPRRVYAFPHLTFEEYLAARYLVRPNFGKMTRDLVQRSDRWREVVMLLGEHLCFAQGDQERMETLLNALTPEKLPASSEQSDWRAIWYTGDLLVISKPLFKNEKPASDKKIRDGLYQLVMRSALSPRERASAADTLDELGYSPPDLYAFLPIPEGQGLLSKYLVTNAQYERFLNAPDFAERKYWVDFPKFDEESGPMKKT